MKNRIATRFARDTETRNISMALCLCASVVKKGFGSFAAKSLLGFSMLLAIGILQGCKYPEPAKVEQKDSRPSIGISGAPEGAVVFVDGLNMGPATRDNEEVKVLLVESGKHVVELKSADGRVLLSEEVFLSSSTRKILSYNP
jgi:hypothetical protein